MRICEEKPELDDLDPFERQAAQRRLRAQHYVPRLRGDQFFSHESAVALLGGPLPLVRHEGRPVNGMTLPVHVSTAGSGPLVRAKGIAHHRAQTSAATFEGIGGARIARPEIAWAQLGSWDLLDLVALGDYFCRAWRTGYGRPDAGRRPMATVDTLRATIASGRRVGIQRLRQAVDLVREDSWSPRESKVRCHLVLAGMPEPELNHDVYDAGGRFLACVDLAYPERKVAIEYQSMLHHSRYAADVERIAALRDAGWTVIEVSAELLARPVDLVDRVRRALAASR
ncbi:hypothetical protein AB0N61_16345 [Microbacterium sp. NPDC089320]|uniref:hypothetical protein n=1 Tax=Microbacterium sp. NPDC089320 TaxID=3155182 RepID=UPI0034361822